jgi:hypothetical protein
MKARLSHVIMQCIDRRPRLTIYSSIYNRFIETEPGNICTAIHRMRIRGRIE